MSAAGYKIKTIMVFIVSAANMAVYIPRKNPLTAK